MPQTACEVLKNVEIIPDVFIAEIRAPEIAGACRPGHFVQVRVTETCDPLWRRPFSVHGVSADRRTVRLLYRRIGRGTTLLSQLRPKDRIDVTGPHGRPFEWDGHFSTALIVAGGLGIAPVFFLADRLFKKGKRIVILWGVRHSGELFGFETLRKTRARIHLATEDGSEGFRGKATDLLEASLPEIRPSGSVRGFACGPMPMLKAIQKITADSGFSWQASLEERMACGIGVCQGCVIRIRKKGYRTVCADGPVFDLGELEFDA